MVPATSRNLYGNMTVKGRRWVAGSFSSSIDVNTTKNDFHLQFYLKILYRGELITGGSPVSEKYVETCFSSNVTGESPALEKYMETMV